MKVTWSGHCSLPLQNPSKSSPKGLRDKRSTHDKRYTDSIRNENATIWLRHLQLAFLSTLMGDNEGLTIIYAVRGLTTC